MTTLSARSLFIIKSMGNRLIAANAADNKQIRDIASLMRLLERFDPTKNKEYLQTIANWYSAKEGRFRLEDEARVHNSLQRFHANKARLSRKDIGCFSCLNELEELLDVEAPYADNEYKSNGEIEREIKANGAVKLIEEPNFVAIKLLTKDAAQYYGRGTKWCTAANTNNAFDSYSDDLIVLLTEIEGKNRKFQFHFRSGQFMNEKDVEVTKDEIAHLSKIAGYTKFLNSIIEKHYQPIYNKAMEYVKQYNMVRVS